MDSDMNKIKVLLIEDDRSISNFITATMDREGYKIMHALNGREGLSLSTSFCPNVILLDLGLPDMDGLDILRSLRSWSSLPGPRSQKTIIASGISACCFGSSSPFPAATCSSRALIALCSIQRSSKSSRIGLK